MLNPSDVLAISMPGFALNATGSAAIWAAVIIFALLLVRRR